ncbi:MAG: two pore domain potassium channel family protein, partial [Deltaproteobacteria bacterium]|nr:two pore domain potassium channel family protein [Deltaproteobacteria bacterium]
MAIVAALLGAGLVLWVLWEGFETIVLPRRVTRRFRLTRLFYRRTWIPWANMVGAIVPARSRETWLSVFGPLSLLLLMII